MNKPDNNTIKINKLIFNTPLIRLNKVVESGSPEILVKIEGSNPGGSVKDRICMTMIEEAEKMVS